MKISNMARILGLGMIAVFVIGFTASCNVNHPYREEIKSVDSLMTVVDYLEGRVDKIPDEKIEARLDSAEQITRILANRKPDSTKRRAWLTKTATVERISRAYSKYISDREDLKSSIDFTEKQLRELRNSLTDEKVTRSEAENYVKDEMLAVHNLQMLVNKRVPEAETAVTLWDSLRSEYDTIYQPSADSTE